MFKYLPNNVYAKLIDVIDNGATLDRSIANAVADGMKKWAIELGVTHYTHWFQPLTEGTAEKHDAFVEHDGKGGMLEEFSGKLLVQQESDGSSFPNGGIRNTFEARGYSAWDPSSPVFVVDDTLCIPTVFIAYTGESLDYKAPLLKALSAVNKAALDVMHYFDPSVKKNHFVPWMGAGILPGRRRVVCCSPGLAADWPHFDGTRSLPKPTVGRPLFWSYSKPCGCLYERFGNPVTGTGYSCQDAPQRGSSEPVRTCSDLRRM